MSEVITIPAKYVFLDVVNFSQDRSVEAQSDIIDALNYIVKASLAENKITEETSGFQMPKFLRESRGYEMPYILSPTGDGMCISLLNIETPYDIHLQLALSIIKGVHDYNTDTENEMRRFLVRIGLNANTDNLITDVNGRPNIAGAGINMASRIMSVADGNQILVGQSVYDTLRQWEKYMSAFRGYAATVKHDLRLAIYQFIQPGHLGLVTDVPVAFRVTDNKQNASPKLSKKAAYFMAHALKHKIFLLRRLGGDGDEDSAIVLFYFLAEDSESNSTSSEISKSPTITHKAETATFEEQLDYYAKVDVFVKAELSRLAGRELFSQHTFCFQRAYNRTFSFVSPEGAQKLKQEWPDIWDEFGLEE